MTDGKVYHAIAAVMAEIGTSGISKDRRNQQQGYNFRGIDEVYNALSPILSKHKLCILPRILARSVTERTTQKGGVLFYVTVEAEFDLVCAEDGSTHTVRTFGEAMDSADKATNKAMSAAYKYAAMQAFCIPTEGDNDADAHTHEVAPNAVPAFSQAHSINIEALYTRLSKANGDCKTKADFNKLWGNANTIVAQSHLSIDNHAQIEKEKAKKFADLEKEEPSGFVPPSFDNLDK